MIARTDTVVKESPGRQLRHALARRIAELEAARFTTSYGEAERGAALHELRRILGGAA